ncbi:hypothetical protein [Sulfitobacter sp. SK012]|nr:hypothetical protein [Sulfitobacter sp. SK012]
MARRSIKSESRTFLTKHQEPAPALAWFLVFGILASITALTLTYFLIV